MRYLVLLTLLLFPLTVSAQDWEDRRLFQGRSDSQVLRITSSTDTSFFAPIIDSFLRDRPDVTIEYLVTSTADLNEIVRQDPDQYDLIISSAQIILPSDFPTTMMRTAFVASSTSHPKAASDFIRHLIATKSNTDAPEGARLPPLESAQDIEGQITIALEPALLTYLDALKRRTFLREWENEIIQQR